MKMGVVFHSADRYNGATRSLLDLIEVWSQNRDVKIICFLPKKDTACNVLDEIGVRYCICDIYSSRYLTTEPINERVLRNQVRRIRLLKEYFLDVPQIAKKIKEEKIDIIYSNTGSIMFGYWLAKRLNISHAWHIREMGEEDQNAKMLFGKHSFISSLNASQYIVAISNTVLNKYLPYIDDKSKIHMHYNDISINNSKYCKHSKHDPFNILIVGSIIEGKGHEQVIRALKMVKESGREILLHVAGKNSGQYFEEMKDLVRQLDLSDNVIFLGHVADMKSLKEQMDIQVVASRCEAFGRITVEAMLCGLPVIGANTGCTKELLFEMGKYGVIYEWNNSTDLATKIEYAFDNYQEMCKIATNAYNFALSFTKGSTANDILMELKEIC